MCVPSICLNFVVCGNGRAASAMAAAAAEQIGALTPAVTLLVSCGLVGAVDVTSLLLKRSTGPAQAGVSR